MKWRLGVLEAILAVALLFFLLQTYLLWYWRQDYHGNRNIKQGADHTAIRLQTQSQHETSLCYRNTSRPSNLSSLLGQMQGRPEWQWISDRMQQLWPVWLNATSDIQYGQHRQLRILLIPGVLVATDFAGNKSLSAGGPLGDLVQWTHLLLALHLLGHKLIISAQLYDAARGLLYDQYVERFATGCPATASDIIFTDIITMKAFTESVIDKVRCLYRVLDAYGTEAMYNDVQYSLSHGYNSQYGKLQLNLKQFYTFYPHSADNSFLGFAVSPVTSTTSNKRPIAVLYGKDPEYFKASAVYIKYLMQYMEVHSTVQNTTSLPAGVFNHGILTARGYRKLLDSAKYFLGVGLPLESTGVMEALGHGCIIINPRFHGNMTRILQTQGKPTTRLLSSQVPYLESIGPPHVYTIDTSNLSEVQSVLKRSQTVKVSPLLPPLFSIRGFISRLQYYIRTQDFCKAQSLSTLPNVTAVIGKESQSCQEVCTGAGLVCDPGLFPKLPINKLVCQTTANGDSVYYPAVSHSARCLIQKRPALYSCAAGHQQLRRLCPCRHKIQNIDM